MACHSRTSEDVQADFKNAWGKGGRVFKGPFGESTAANISGHKEKGLGGWTDAEIKRALTEGTSKDGAPVEAADDRLRRLLQDLEGQRDRRADRLDADHPAGGMTDCPGGLVPGGGEPLYRRP